LRAWRDYFKNAVIIGGDIDENLLFEEDRIHTALLDQMDPSKIELFFALLPPKYPDQFDIIIDDGCHIYEATICLFENSFQHMKPNGIYIIEDMAEEHFQKYRQYFEKHIEENHITIEYQNMVNINADPHNNLIIIRKNNDKKI
jgi:SAM-dependent methyltransferase